MNKPNLNRIWIGALAGILIPGMALMAFYLLRYSDIGLVEFLKGYKSMGILTHIISLAVLPDLLIFFLFIRYNLLKSARGVLLATFLFTFAVVFIRFF
jgi:hypothetical protein